MKTPHVPHPASNRSQSHGLTVAQRIQHGVSNLETGLRSLYQTSGLVDVPAQVGAASNCKLKRGSACSIISSARNRRLKVNSGIVWLTETPGNGDVLLRASDSHELTGSGRAVIEALEDAEIVLGR